MPLVCKQCFRCQNQCACTEDRDQLEADELLSALFLGKQKPNIAHLVKLAGTGLRQSECTYELILTGKLSSSSSSWPDVADSPALLLACEPATGTPAAPCLWALLTDPGAAVHQLLILDSLKA